ncbi:hypothetical protein [Enterovirga rhinocerotis]|uniref:Uncharacterized protein n=1 Tax=Enterovirga rhinocerotis TaxID=1339210 RepID=A0A4R7BZQ7_9HYPH|nr:hypothetical protein [Enterovirga rhinocerotis]TDR90255.1 hypothetical protein EV668_3097 [Enterovirga rhinocerotis]
MITTVHLDAAPTSRNALPAELARAMLLAVKPLPEWAAEERREPPDVIHWIAALLILAENARLDEVEARGLFDRLGLDQVEAVLARTFQ